MAAVCAGFVWTAPATGAFMDGDRLLAKCNEDPGEGLAVCVGYGAGIADVLLIDSVRGRERFNRGRPEDNFLVAPGAGKQHRMGARRRLGIPLPGTG